MARVFVSVGSNVDRERHIGLALELLRARFGDYPDFEGIPEQRQRGRLPAAQTQNVGGT